MRKTCDALFLLPPSSNKNDKNKDKKREAIGLGYLKSCLEKENYSAEIINAETNFLNVDQVCQEVNNNIFSVFGVSIIQKALPETKLITDEIKESNPNSLIVGGGFTPTLSPENVLKTLPSIDLLVLGEGEKTIIEIIKSIKEEKALQELDGIAYRENERTIIKPQSAKIDINSLPRPARDEEDITFKNAPVSIVGSRGCYGNCTFCSNKSFEQFSKDNGWRGRKPEDIVEEIEELQKKYGVKSIKFNDANLFGPKEEGRNHVEKICKELIARKINNLSLTGFCRPNDISPENVKLLKEAGFKNLIIGIESGNQEILDRFRRRTYVEDSFQALECLRKAKIEVIPGFLFFNPYTTIESMKKDLNFLSDQRIFPILTKALKIYDGTPLQDEIESEGRLLYKNPLEGYHEYIMPEDVSNIFIASKTLSNNWLEPFSSRLEDKMRQIQKRNSTDCEKGMTGLSVVIYDLERYFIKNLIKFIETSFTKNEIKNLLTTIKSRLEQIENYIISNIPNLYIKERITKSFSVIELSEIIFKILKSKKNNSFPESYLENSIPSETSTY